MNYRRLKQSHFHELNFIIMVVKKRETGDRTHGENGRQRAD